MGNLTTQAGPLDYEEVQFFFRKHWTHFLKPLIFGLTVGLLSLLAFLVIGAIVTVFKVSFLYILFGFLVIIISIFFINIFFLQLFNFYFNVIIVTNCRIVIARKTVFLKNDNDAIDLTKIQDVGVIAHGVFRNYLNFGALIITLSTSSPPVVIPFAPNPHYYLEQINRVKRQHILHRQEGRTYTRQKVSRIPLGYLKDIDKLEYGA